MEKRICRFSEDLSPQNKLGPQITNPQIAKKIGSANHESANLHTCSRSTNITNFVSPKICRFAICGTYSPTSAWQAQC